MRKIFACIIILSIILLIFDCIPVVADEDVETPDPPTIEWDSDYSSSATSQKVTMYAEKPDGAYKLEYVLFANDVKQTKVTTSESCSFYSLDEQQEVWGYVVALDKNNNRSERSELVSEYIGKKSKSTKKVDTPEEPEIEWVDANKSKNNNQKVKVSAEIPEGAKYLRYFLICDGDIRSSSKTTSESYTFSGVDYNQMVVAYVKAYDSSGNDSYQSETVTLYIGDDGEVSTPAKPQVRWIDYGYNSPYGQVVEVSAEIPSDANRLKYFIIANGTMVSSELTTSTRYTFYNIKDDQMVTAFVKAYDKWDNESDESERTTIYIPKRSTGQQSSSSSQTTPSQTGGQTSQQPTGRISNAARGISIRDFQLPPRKINASFHFEDVPAEDKELHEALQYLYSTGIYDGAFQRNFYPNKSMSRIDFLNALIRATGMDSTTIKYISHYKDVKPDYLYHNNILLASEKRIMNGYSDHTFRPDGALTYGAAAKAVAVAFEMRRYSSQGESLIDDFQQDYLDVLVSSGILSNKPDSTATVITRGEATRLLYRILKLKINQ
ncbi:MAG: S-layer homology domain-containing protein [Clostridiaceae bacterium]|nr:S-layer homology domain-containing protein [Clostridiaceae bacterium]